jgi:hypothetical protein
MGWGPPKSEALGSHPASPPSRPALLLPKPLASASALTPSVPRPHSRRRYRFPRDDPTAPDTDPTPLFLRPAAFRSRAFPAGAVPSSWPGRSGLEDEGCSPLMSVSWPSRSQRHRYGLPLNKKGTMETRSKQNRRHAFDFVSRITL